MAKMARWITSLVVLACWVSVICVVGAQRAPSSLTCDEPCDRDEVCRLSAMCSDCNKTRPFCFTRVTVDAMYQTNGFDDVFCGSQGVVVYFSPKRRELRPVKCLQGDSCPNMSFCKTRIQDGEQYCCALYAKETSTDIKTDSGNRTMEPNTRTTKSATLALLSANETVASTDPTVVNINSTVATPNTTTRAENTTVVHPTNSNNQTERKAPSLTCFPPCLDANTECRILSSCKTCDVLFTVCLLKDVVDAAFTKNRFREDFCGPQGVLMYLSNGISEIFPVKCHQGTLCPDQAECKMSFTDGLSYCCARPHNAGKDGKTTPSTTLRPPSGPQSSSPTPTFPPYVTYENQTFSLIIDYFSTLLPSTSDAGITGRSTTTSNPNKSLSRKKRSYRNRKGIRSQLKKDKPDCISLILHSTKEEWDSKILAPPASKKIPDPKRSTISLVLVLDQISSVECTEGVTFFFMGRILLVRGGCSALFMVCFKTSGILKPSLQEPAFTAALTTAIAPALITVTKSTSTTVSATTKTTTAPGKEISGCRNVILRSSLSRNAISRLAPGSGPITSMDLVRQFSTRECVNGFSFGFGASFAIAIRGCQGEFQICQNVTTTTTSPTAELTTAATEFTSSPVPLTTESKLRTRGCYKLSARSPSVRSLTKKVIRDKNGNPATITSVKLIEDLPPRKCIKEDTFFYHDTSLYLTGKCWGYFLICYKVKTQNVTNPAPTSVSKLTTSGLTTSTISKPSCKLVTLMSTNKYPDARLILDSEYRHVNITKVTLLMERSKNRCRQGKGYLVKEAVISARNGCAGDFVVCFEKQPSDRTKTTTADSNVTETSGITKNTLALTTRPEIIPTGVATTDAQGRAAKATTTQTNKTQTDGAVETSTSGNGNQVEGNTTAATTAFNTNETQTVGFKNSTVEPASETQTNEITIATPTPNGSETDGDINATVATTSVTQTKGTTNVTPTPTRSQTDGDRDATAATTSLTQTKGTTSITPKPGNSQTDGDMNATVPTPSESQTAGDMNATAASATETQTEMSIDKTETSTSKTKATTASSSERQTSGGANPTITPSRPIGAVQTVEFTPKATTSLEYELTTISPSPLDSLTCELYGLVSNSTTEGVLLINDSSDIPAKIQYVKLIAPPPSISLCRKGETFFFIESVLIAQSGCSGEFEVCFLESECIEQRLLSGAEDAPKTFTFPESDGLLIEIRSLSVVRRIGVLPCVEWESFYYVDDKVVVRDGCQALFQICYVKFPRN